jgi:hypothetical protein
LSSASTAARLLDGQKWDVFLFRRSRRVASRRVALRSQEGIAHGGQLKMSLLLAAAGIART